MQPYSKHANSVKTQRKWIKFIKRALTQVNSFALVLVLSLFVTGSCLIYLYLWANYLGSGYRLQDIEKNKEALELQIHLYKIEINYLTRLDRLDRIANKDLHMQQAQFNQHLVFEELGQYGQQVSNAFLTPTPTDNSGKTNTKDASATKTKKPVYSAKNN